MTPGGTPARHDAAASGNFLVTRQGFSYRRRPPREQPQHDITGGSMSASEAFERSFRGRLIRPSDADYDTARALYNGMIDKRPALIARCADAADVISCVNFARDAGLLVAIRGGGHNGPGLGSVD